MKIRHPELIKLAGFSLSWLARVLVGTVRFRCVALGPRVEPTRPGLQGRYLYAFWHETILLPAYHYSHTPTCVLISEHADGEMIARACGHLGLKAVRGSTTRGGARALRELVELKGRSHVVITPDGPRGPRRQVQPGLIYVAARTGLPIVPCGYGYHSAWRLRSWDRFAVPRPFSAAVGVLGEPIAVPPDLGRGQVEGWRAKVQAALDHVTQTAEALAARESW
jgi:lysophospholipid acyltransferase (LPLAT)-like uncharacterized protein